MIELKPSENSTVGYNISLPTSAGKGMESVVSLTHERNMADSYNTFVITLFNRVTESCLEPILYLSDLEIRTP